MKARDVMTTDLVTVGPEASVAETAQLMLDHRISAVPVVAPDGAVIGIVSEGDLIRRVEAGTARPPSRWRALLTSEAALAAEYVKSHARSVRDLMVAPVISVTEDVPLATIADLMESHRIKRVVVLRDGKLAGIVSRSNLLEALVAPQGAKSGPAAAADLEIRDRVIAEINRQPWGSAKVSRVVVTDGIVHLWGSVLTDEEQQATRVAAETVPGARGVVDHMTKSVRVPAIA